MDNVLVSETKGGGVSKKAATPSERREEEQNEENGQVLNGERGEASFTTAHGCQGQPKWL